MMGTVYWLIPLVGLFYIGVIINFIRKRRLQEGHSLLWLLTFALVTISPFFVPALDRLALWLGIFYSPTLYLLVAIFFLMANVLSNSLDISRLTDSNRRLTQETSLLRQQVERLERLVGGGKRPE